MGFLTTGEAAVALHVTIPTVKRWVKDGQLRAFKTLGGHYRIADAELQRFLAEHELPGLAERPQRILIVEDEPSHHETLFDALGFEGHYKVEVAEDGYEGLIKVGTFRPHLLILDLWMPGLDGFHVCRKVKQDAVTLATKIVAITGDAGGNARERILEAGADGFLEKPIALAVLRAEVERLLGVPTRRSPAATSPTELRSWRRT